MNVPILIYPTIPTQPPILTNQPLNKEAILPKPLIIDDRYSDLDQKWYEYRPDEDDSCCKYDCCELLFCACIFNKCF